MCLRFVGHGVCNLLGVRELNIKPLKDCFFMKSYQCNVCKHIYSPDEGDPQQNIAAGTPFEELPDSWRCPVCGVGKEAFHEVESKS